MTTYTGRDFWAVNRPKWSVAPLKSLGHLGTGHTPSRSHPEYWENCTIPWVTTEDLTSRRDGGLKPLQETRQHVSELGLANSAAVLHPADTVMLSRTASIGHVVRIGRAMATTQAFVTWTCGPLLNPRYLTLVLVAMKPEFERIAYGSTHLTIYMPDIEQLRVPLPPLTEQRAIADYLDIETARIDALIAKKRRMIDLLEERWRAELDARTAGRPRALRRIVSRFVDYRGATPEKAVMGVPLVTASHVKDGMIRHELEPQYLDQPTYRLWMRRGFPSVGDVVMTTEAPLGEVAQLMEADIALAQRLILLKPDKRVSDPTFLSYALRSSRFQEALFASATGSTALGIKADRLKGLEVANPPVADQLIAARSLRQLEQRKRATQRTLSQQLTLLVEHRQALITAAVTGAIEVPGAA